MNNESFRKMLCHQLQLFSLLNPEDNGKANLNLSYRTIRHFYIRGMFKGDGKHVSNTNIPLDRRQEVRDLSNPCQMRLTGGGADSCRKFVNT